MGWAGPLGNLGFTLEQMVRCRTSSGGVVFVPARVNDEQVQLAFSNYSGYTCHLYESYATDHGLPISTDGEGRYTQIESLSACGRTTTSTRAHVWGAYRDGSPPIAGFLCAPFFRDGVAAIDASVPAIAFATTRENLSLDGAISRLRFNGDRIILNGQTFAIAMGMASSVTPEYLGEKRPGRHGRADLTLTLPGGVTLTESVNVRPSKVALSGILGADLLCRWITVFDFPSGELLLFPYD